MYPLGSILKARSGTALMYHQLKSSTGMAQPHNPRVILRKLELRMVLRNPFSKVCFVFSGFQHRCPYWVLLFSLEDTNVGVMGTLPPVQNARVHAEQNGSASSNPTGANTGTGPLPNQQPMMFTRKPPPTPALLPEYRYCYKDGFVKPTRAHHCRACGTVSVDAHTRCRSWDSSDREIVHIEI